MDNRGESKEILLSVGAELYEAGNYEEAFDFFEEAHAYSPDVRTLNWLASTRWKLGDLNGALEYYNLANVISPYDSYTLGRRGALKREKEDYTGAFEDFEEAFELSPNDPWLLTNQGMLMINLEDYVLALQKFNAADLLKPNEALTIQMRGYTKKLLNQLQEALDDLNRADQLEPNNAFTLCHRGDTKRLMMDGRGAVDDFDRADQMDPDNAFILRCRGDAKRLLKSYPGALEDLNRADNLVPNDAETLTVRGDVKRLLGDYKGALEDLNQAAHLQQKNWQALYARGLVKVALKAYMEGINDFSRALAWNPSDKDIRKARALAKKTIGDTDLDADEIALTSTSYSETIYNFVALASFKVKLVLNQSKEVKQQEVQRLHNSANDKILQKDYSGAIRDLNEAIDMDESNGVLFRKRGEMKWRIGRTKDALKDLYTAEKLLPNDAVTIATRALVYFDLNQMQAAHANFTLYDELIPDNTDYMDEKATVSKLLDRPIMFNDIEIIKLIGEGGFADVYLAKWGKKQIALKKPRGIGSESLIAEARALMKFRHNNIITLLGYCGGVNNEVSLMMEYAQEGSLQYLLYKEKVVLAHEKILKFARDIASGLLYLHGRRVVHRDLKSANILLFKNLAKIADFGLSRFLREKSVAKTLVGTPYFMAPEILAEQPYNNSADVYSFGVLLYEMCTNSMLPIFSDEADRMAKIQKDVKDAQFSELIKKCCRTKPYLRITIQECLSILTTMETTRTIELPKEIWNLVLGYYRSDYIKRLQFTLVCRAWRDLIIRSTNEISLLKGDGSNLDKIVNRWSCLESLILPKFGDGISSLTCLSTLPHLRSLGMIYKPFRLANRSAEDFNLFANLTQLTHLTVGAMSSEEDLLKLSTLTNLYSLDLKSYEQSVVKKDGFNMMKHMTRLTSFHAPYWTSWNPECSDKISHLTNLKTIKIESPGSMFICLDKLSNLTNLEHAVLSCQNDQELEHIRHWTNLTYLQCNHLSMARGNFHYITSLQKLRHFTLANGELPPTTFVTLASCVELQQITFDKVDAKGEEKVLFGDWKDSTKLKRLIGLPYHADFDTGITSLPQSLTSLSVYDIHGNASRFFKSLLHFTQLAALQIEANSKSVTDDTIYSIARLRPLRLLLIESNTYDGDKYKMWKYYRDNPTPDLTQEKLDTRYKKKTFSHLSISSLAQLTQLTALYVMQDPYEEEELWKLTRLRRLKKIKLGWNFNTENFIKFIKSDLPLDQ